MNGAESLLRTLIGAGVEVCFANPGTSEMHFVAALDKVEGMRPVLCLFEGVVTGMADGYGRMADKPAATLLHLGPGLANGLANLHNARRAATPIVNIVGDHATFHIKYDAPLTIDITSFARPVSAWLHKVESTASVARDGARAVQAALEPPGMIATLILPADIAWSEGSTPAQPLGTSISAKPADAQIEVVAQALKAGKRTALLMRGRSLRARALHHAGRIAAASGARLLCDTFAPRIERGAGRVAVERLPYFAEQIAQTLNDLEVLVLVGAKSPVAFFAYPGKPSDCVPEGCQVLTLAREDEDGQAALEALAAALNAPKEPLHVAALKLADAPTGKLDQFTVGQVISRFLPENAIIADEALTSTLGPTFFTVNAAPHDHLALTGGAIGLGLPLGAGASLGCPDRKVICLQADGSGMYTLQALWTQARERLDVTNVIFANHSYAILNIELTRLGVDHPGLKALSMFDLGNPNLNWVQLANGMGVEASRAETIEEFSAQFSSAMKAKGPRLIEVVI